MAKKNVTFADIAAYTNFSKTTISRYFNNPDSLTLENQEKIREALIKLDYKENKVARILASGKTEFIGLVIPDLTNSYYAETLRQILMTYEEYGYKFLVFNGDYQKDHERKYLSELASYKIEGLVVLSHTLSSRELADMNIPVVSIEREDQFISSVNCDNYMGAIQATSLLAKHNCDILIHVNTPTNKDQPTYQRIQGFKDFCEEHQLPNQILFHTLGAPKDKLRKELTEMFEMLEKNYPDKRKGIFFSNDNDASEFLKILIRKYQVLPSNYRIVGFDGAPISEEAIYSITTVAQQIDKIVEEAMELLMVQINERKKRNPQPLEPVHKVVTPILIRRETTEFWSD